MATARQLEHAKGDLYEQDFTAWIEDQAQALRTRQIGALDWDNLLEEIESMGRSEKNALKSRLRVLLMHLIKWKWQPEKRSQSWLETIIEQRASIEEILEMSPSLGTTTLPDAFSGVWAKAISLAALETGLPPSAFSPTCPWSMDEVLREDWMPE